MPHGPDEIRPPAVPTVLPAAWAHVGPVVDGAALAARPGVWLLTGLLRVYQVVVSPLLGPRCRFHPTCSSYALDALRGHGLVRGIAMTLLRLAKCGPWHPGGLDPVPPRSSRPSRPPRAHRPTGPGAPNTEEHAA